MPVKGNGPQTAPEKMRPVVVAVIGAAGAIAAAGISYVATTGGLTGGTFDYTGQVRTLSGQPVPNALVTIAEDQRVPQHLRTDSEGVFHARLLKKDLNVRLDVKAAGYLQYDVYVQPSRTGFEEVLLTPDANQGRSNSDIKGASAFDSYHTSGKNSPIITGGDGTINIGDQSGATPRKGKTPE